MFPGRPKQFPGIEHLISGEPQTNLGSASTSFKDILGATNTFLQCFYALNFVHSSAIVLPLRLRRVLRLKVVWVGYPLVTLSKFVFSTKNVRIGIPESQKVTRMTKGTLGNLVRASFHHPVACQIM